MTRVFLSYRHEDQDHIARVCDLGRRLEAAGITVILDQFAQQKEFNGGGPNEGWTRWCATHAGAVQNKILIVGSPGWFSVYQQTTIATEGLGAAQEARIIEQRLYNTGGISPDIRIVEFTRHDKSVIPLGLQPYHRFHVPNECDDLIRWLTGGAAPKQSVARWFTEPPTISWVMANHDVVRQAFSDLVTEGSSIRYLPIRGGSGSGKSHITKQLLGYALQCQGLACGRFDCKAVTDAETEFQRFVQNLDVPAPASAPGLALIHRFNSLLAALQHRKQPALLIFDTFELAGEVERWVKDTLLLATIRQEWLRVVIAGQRVPERGASAWDRQAAPAITVTPPAPQHWFDFGRHFQPSLRLEDVETVHRFARGSGTLMYQMFGPQSE